MVGLAGERIWQALRGGIGVRDARLVALPVTLVLFAIFANFTDWIFTYTDVEIFRPWAIPCRLGRSRWWHSEPDSTKKNQLA